MVRPFIPRIEIKYLNKFPPHRFGSSCFHLSHEERRPKKHAPHHCPKSRSRKHRIRNVQTVVIVGGLQPNGEITRNKPALASQCIECGKCLEKCPQHLPIPDLLTDVADDMEGLMTKPLIWLVRRAMRVRRA